MTRTVALLGEVDENPVVMDSEDLVERLVRILEGQNQELAEVLTVPLSVPGEVPEFVAVLRDLGAAYPLSRTIAEALHPLPVRVAVCVGEVNLSPGATPDSIDGPAFDEAAELIYRGRKEDRMLTIRSGDDPVDLMANALCLLLYRDLQTWTERQCEVVRLYRRFGRQQDVAEELGVSQQSVSSSLAGAGWKSLSEAEAALKTAIS
jgi:hypothetical protein